MIKRTSLEHINSILRQNTNWNILDIGCGYTAHPKATIICDVLNLADYYQSDKLHPNAAGVNLMVEGIKPFLVHLIELPPLLPDA